MKRPLVLFLLVCVALIGTACGGGETTAPTELPTAEPGGATELTEEEAAAFAAALDPDAATAGDDAAADGDCEAYFRFCVAASVSGTVESVATGGVGANIDTCAVWAAPGEARILELPMMLAAGEDAITVALTRIAAYTGPGRYELVSVSTDGIPDMFPTMEVAGRTFAEGEGATAVVTVNADGSGTLDATGLAEIASIGVSNPDPTARVDLGMQWTCQDS